MSAPDPYAVGLAVLERFNRQNESNKAQATRLREAIRAVDELHLGPRPLGAEVVRSLLNVRAPGGDLRPALRTVQRHLREIRAKRRRDASV